MVKINGLYLMTTILYGSIIINQLVCSTFIINKEREITNIINSNNFLTNCSNDYITELNRHNNGALFNNTFAMLITSIITIGFYFIKKIPIKTRIIDERQLLINNNIEVDMPIYIYHVMVNTIFILSIWAFVIINIVQFILQFNISPSCLDLIKINNFNTIYNLMNIVSLISFVGIFILIPISIKLYQ